MAQYASNAVLINGPQYLKSNVTIAYVCKAPLKADTVSTIISKSIASVAVANADISINVVGDNVVMTGNAKSGLDPSGTATAGEDIAVVYCSVTENLGAVDATDRIITNEVGDTIDIPASQVTINNWELIMRVSAFQGASNTETYTVKRNGEAFDLNAAGVTRIEIVESGQSIDSTTDAVVYNGPLLTIRWSELGDRLMSGKFSPYIYAYKAGDTKGELIFGPNLSPIYLTVIEDERP